LLYLFHDAYSGQVIPGEGDVHQNQDIGNWPDGEPKFRQRVVHTYIIAKVTELNPQFSGKIAIIRYYKNLAGRDSIPVGWRNIRSHLICLRRMLVVPGSVPDFPALPAKVSGSISTGFVIAPMETNSFCIELHHDFRHIKSLSTTIQYAPQQGWRVMAKNRHAVS